MSTLTAALAAAYIATVGSLAFTAASLAILPLHGQAAGLLFITISIASTALAGALTPRWANPYTQAEDEE